VAIKNKAEKLRFGLVGIANTTIDISILFFLTFLGLPSLASNIISTSCAFTFSFFVNRTYTFHAHGNAKRQAILFIIVTLFSLWGIQSAVIWIVTSLLATTALEKSLALLIAKLIAVAASLIWNYIMYSRVVFKERI
jgi:putative flippase GtrA